jgi:hypothetical protein
MAERGERRKEGGDQRSGSIVGTSSLDDLGVTKKQSHLWLARACARKGPELALIKGSSAGEPPLKDLGSRRNNRTNGRHGACARKGPAAKTEGVDSKTASA